MEKWINDYYNSWTSEELNELKTKQAELLLALQTRDKSKEFDIYDDKFRTSFEEFPMLDHLDLRGFDFSMCDLNGMMFDGSNLEGANFSNSNLYNCYFEGANLTGCIMNGANIYKTRFTRAIINYVDFSNIKSSCAEFRADFSNACVNYSKFDSLELDAMWFNNADLSHSSFRNCIFNKNTSGIAGSNMSYTDLTNAKMIGCVIMCDLTGSVLNGADLSYAQICVNFTNANLDSANFNNASFTRTDFTGATILFASFENAVLDQYSSASLVDRR